MLSEARKCPNVKVGDGKASRREGVSGSTVHS